MFKRCKRAARILQTALSMLIVLAVLCSCSLSAKDEPPIEASPSPSKTPAGTALGIPSEPALPIKDNYKIGVSLRFADHIFVITIAQAINDCVEDWEKNLGCNIDIITKEGSAVDPTKQHEDLAALADEPLDGLVIFPGDSKGVAPIIDELFMDKGVPVVITDIGVDTENYTSWVCPDYYACGAVAGEAMAKVADQGVEIAVFNHAPDAENCRSRCQGFIDKCDDLGLKPLDVYVMPPHNDEFAMGKEALAEVLGEHPDIGGVFIGSFPYNYGFLAALEEAGRENIEIVCFDLNMDTVELVKSGKVAASVVNDPYYIGYEGVNQLMYAVTGQTSSLQKRIIPQARVMTKANAEEFINDPQIKFSKNINP